MSKFTEVALSTIEDNWNKLRWGTSSIAHTRMPSSVFRSGTGRLQASSWVVDQSIVCRPLMCTINRSIETLLLYKQAKLRLRFDWAEFRLKEPRRSWNISHVPNYNLFILQGPKGPRGIKGAPGDRGPMGERVSVGDRCNHYRYNTIHVCF